MPVKVGMIGLGCAKNQVDGEMLMASLRQGGYETVLDLTEADVVIVNTCGFIDSAKQESIGEILELADLKAAGFIDKIVVTGCLAERYKDDIMKNIPEVDAVMGIGANGEIVAKFDELCKDIKVESFPDKYLMPLCGERDLSTPPYWAYIKIAEGCDNNCTYCAIPMIRGKQRSRTIENIVEEAEKLVAGGVKELVVIAQDTSRYGIDLYGEYSLARLLKELCKIENLKWIRVLYCYPEAITDELIDVMANEEKIVKYIDLPLQHASGKVLKRMNRRGDRQSLTELINKLRERIPGLILRSTFIAGFPGETEDDFVELAEFVKEIKFDRMGCFAYSQEEGTPAARLPEQLDDEVKQDRADIIMESQMAIMDECNRRHIGKQVEVMVESYDEFSESWYGRSYMDAPDVDGYIYFKSQNHFEPGEFANVVLEDCVDSDLFGKEI
ncbi:MAG: 30S ribosomal protein S12 methylthiotransferase RimO [Clostridia bacterium]|nr:30S ribosomal protein S12 methylthiotransferase RimO [Clostridia bacterium]